jgi:mannose-6-phosphate isomerase-like protein (cupin superfamily)
MSPTTLTPWGYYKTILEYPFTKVKMILVKPDEILSYQYHYKRSEVWTIVQGTAKVRIDGMKYIKKVGDVIQLPKEAKHQIENIGKDDLVFIEVQLGEYFGEDDIVRLEDKYGRV